ncbi:ribosome small subunit-dependent GTPase A [Streptomyces sp. TE5632]
MSSTSSFSTSSVSLSASRSSALAAYGWDGTWADAFAPYEAEGLLAGRVVRVDRGQCDVVTADGTVRADTAFVTPRDPLRVVCTGDWVAVEPEGHTPRYVRAYLPRRTAFVRSTSSERSEGQILAANVDHAVIAVSLADELDLARIERFLALAWESGAQPVIVLTKADLVPDAVTRAHLVQDVETTAPGVPVLAVSAQEAGSTSLLMGVPPVRAEPRTRGRGRELGGGLDVLAAVVSGGTSVLIGVSGAGKSTLANVLLGEDVMDVRAAREVDGKGRHTTTTRNLLALPGGGVLIDTPGLRGVGLWDAGSGVSQVFSEIEELAGGCRFHDCAHESEPGCAVLEAIETGALPERRLESYRKLLRENQRIVAKTDARLRAEIRKEWKRKGAVGKAAMEAKRGRLR